MIQQSEEMAIEFRLNEALKRHEYFDVENKLQRNVLVATLQTFYSKRIIGSTEHVERNESRPKFKLSSVAMP